MQPGRRNGSGGEGEGREGGGVWERWREICKRDRLASSGGLNPLLTVQGVHSKSTVIIKLSQNLPKIV